jgi:hypothetical protein
MPMTHRSRGIRFVATVVLLALAAEAVRAAPRDDALRLAPPDAALVLVVQDARDHVRDLGQSPFAEWFPTSGLGKQLLTSVDLGGLKGSLVPLFGELGVTPEDLLNDVLGDAFVFAYSPAPAGNPTDERAVFLLRLRKPETLTKLLDRLNAIQIKNGEVKEVVRRTHNGEVYFERQKQKPGDGSDFYCFRGDVFAFSSSEPDIKAVIDRDRTIASVDKNVPELVAKMTRLGVADSLLVVLVNPRPFDSEVKARVDRAKPDERLFLERFQEVWKALDTAALYLRLGSDLELGVSVRFKPDRLPPETQSWLTGPRTPARIWSAIPDDTLIAIAGRFRAAELIETLGSLVPDKGKNALKAAVEQHIGPIVGKDKLPLVLAALGPDWALWAMAPNGTGYLPTAIAAVEVSGNGEAGRVLLDALDYGFRTARVSYNSGHPDQIEVQETRDGDVIIRSLVNDKGFPTGFRPSFALKGGYLLIATSPDAIKAFRAPTDKPRPSGDVTLVRYSAAATRSYLLANRTRLAKFLSDTGNGDEKELLKQLDQIIGILEPLDRVELITSGETDGIRLAVRVKFVKPLKK